jgi:hypothetical protein
MICSAKPELTEDWCVVQKEEFNNILCAKYKLEEKPSTFIRDKPISSERMLHKGYYRKRSVGKQISGRGSHGVWRQD